jgi:hypothetical protein
MREAHVRELLKQRYEPRSINSQLCRQGPLLSAWPLSRMLTKQLTLLTFVGKIPMYRRLHGKNKAGE